MSMPVAPTLNDILNSDPSADLAVAVTEEVDDGNEDTTPEGCCVECKDQKAQVFCEQCQEDFCEVCGGMIHRTGRRRQHVLRALEESSSFAETDKEKVEMEEPEETALSGGASSVTFNAQSGQVDAQGFGEWITERTKFIPLRLTLKERKYLRLLEAALHVSEYTDRIDVLQYGNKTKRIVAQIKELCAILSGLVVASDYKAGQQLCQERQFADNEQFFQKIFEIGRRHKIMNPEKMRSEYGKLMHLLQDAQASDVQAMLGFSIVAPIKTVHSVLESLGVLYVLEDEMVVVATKEIVGEGRPRAQVQLEIKQKERAIEYLCKAYATIDCPAEVLRQCLYSIGDNHAFLRATRDACDRMLSHLTRDFSPQRAESDRLSLAILSGRNGARLSHSHERQFRYVHQTLALWRELLHDMFMLWHSADSDMLALRNPYRLMDTGQGLQRVQPCQRVSRAAHQILHRTQKSVGRWVGSAVIHLGDRNVPNALIFIDKYNQVASILNPVVRVLEFLDRLQNGQERGDIREYVEQVFGGAEMARKLVLADFFRSAFDGSGADNFFDAGSCIDGRLTSAWNWCSSIEKKPYFPVFLLSGFVGFNGGPEGFS